MKKDIQQIKAVLRSKNAETYECGKWLLDKCEAGYNYFKDEEIEVKNVKTDVSMFATFNVVIKVQIINEYDTERGGDLISSSYGDVIYSDFSITELCNADAETLDLKAIPKEDLQEIHTLFLNLIEQ